LNKTLETQYIYIYLLATGTASTSTASGSAVASPPTRFLYQGHTGEEYHGIKISPIVDIELKFAAVFQVKATRGVVHGQKIVCLIINQFVVLTRAEAVRLLVANAYVAGVFPAKALAALGEVEVERVLGAAQRHFFKVFPYACIGLVVVTETERGAGPKMLELARGCHGRVLVEPSVEYYIGLPRTKGFVLDKIDLLIIHGHDVVISTMVRICDGEETSVMRHGVLQGSTRVNVLQ
jgi:hypothetical protein